MLIQLSPEHMHHMSQIINILPFGLIGSCYFVLQPLKTLVATFVASLSNRGVMVCICKDTVSECMFTIVSSSLYFGFFWWVLFNDMFGATLFWDLFGAQGPTSRSNLNDVRFPYFLFGLDSWIFGGFARVARTQQEHMYFNLIITTF